MKEKKIQQSLLSEATSSNEESSMQLTIMQHDLSNSFSQVLSHPYRIRRIFGAFFRDFMN